MKIQPYFESGFPYAHDQWISQAATAWATIGLTMTALDQPATLTAERQGARSAEERTSGLTK
jgi:hypothetical protein